MRENFAKRGFKAGRLDEIEADFTLRNERYIADGVNDADAASLALRDLTDEMEFIAREKARRDLKAITLQASNAIRIDSSQDVIRSKWLLDGGSGPGASLAKAAVSLIENDARFTGTSYVTRREGVVGQVWALFDASLNDLGKGAFGRQKGKAHSPNIIRELEGTNTRDVAAGNFAKSWDKASDLMVDLFNQAGGSMRRLKGYKPQPETAGRLHKAGRETWVQHALARNDWDMTRWPDGSLVPPASRVKFLENVYDTRVTNGANKIDPKAFRGQGKALGNMIDSNRVMHYTKAEDWLFMHNKYGDGTIFDVFQRHIEDMAHKIAAVDTFGPNPGLTKNNLVAMVRSKAQALGPEELVQANNVLKDKFEPMMDAAMRENPMDPESIMGSVMTGTSNVLTSAFLGSAVMLAVKGDLLQSAAVRKLNGQGLFDGLSFYIKSLLTDRANMRSIATSSGWVAQQAVMSTYSMTRFSAMATYGPAVTRVMAEATMRASGMTGHTSAARFTVKAELASMMYRMRDTRLEDTPYGPLFKRYGITPEEWDALRTRTPVFSPSKGVDMIRPIDLLESDVPNAQLLFQKFQGMIDDEARLGVPDATMEAANMLRGTTRPDTLVGMILHSFSMFKNFPVSFQMIYGRLGMTSPNAKGRIGFYAGLGAGMTLVGALGTQLREIAKGRDPLPMANAAFIGKSFLSGGALGIYADVIFSGVNEYGRGPEGTLAGPVAGFLGDTTDLVLGDVFSWADSMGTLSSGGFESKFSSKAVAWARRYFPGSTVWWARAVLERQVFDRLEELADPQAYSKRQRHMRTQLRERGNEYWWAPGQRLPSRAPDLGG